jgi:glycosyltransferase involved in cell wall biosynthesis
MRIVWTGTFDPSFSRNRKLARLLELMDADVDVRRVGVWADDRVAEARSGKLRAGLALLTALPRLAWTLARTPAPDAYLVSYPGWFDVPLVALFGRIKGRPVVFDPFISLYDTMISDRRMYAEGSVVARVVSAIDRIALRLADVVLADTGAHLEFFAELSGGRVTSGGVIPLGADDDVFVPQPGESIVEGLVVFHGTFVPLQGLATIAEAIRSSSHDVRVRIIGDGQDRAVLDEGLRDVDPARVERVGLVPLDAVPREIGHANVCLGIFGTSDKAGRVVPHKLYECLAVGRPVITRESPAIASMFEPGEVVTVPAGDGVALARAIEELLGDDDRCAELAAAGHRAYRERFHEAVLAERLETLLRPAITSCASGPQDTG